MRLRIGDVHDIVPIECNRGRPGQIHFERRTIAIEPVLTGPDDGCDDPGFTIDPANPVAAGIANEEVVL